jgi:hypothetical protein
MTWCPFMPAIKYPFCTLAKPTLASVFIWSRPKVRLRSTCGFFMNNFFFMNGKTSSLQLSWLIASAASLNTVFVRSLVSLGYMKSSEIYNPFEYDGSSFLVIFLGPKLITLSSFCLLELICKNWFLLSL